MARIPRRGRLTDAYVEGLTKPGFHRDGLMPGFGIRAGSRRKTWELRIERRGREKVFETLGRWPTMKADEARATAHDILARYERREAIKAPPAMKVVNLLPPIEGRAPHKDDLFG